MIISTVKTDNCKIEPVFCDLDPFFVKEPELDWYDKSKDLYPPKITSLFKKATYERSLAELRSEIKLSTSG